MDEMTPSPRRAGRVWVTPKAEGMLEGAAGVPGATEDEKLLERTPSTAWLETDPWRTLRIQAEFVEGFDAMAKVGAAVTVFGSARTVESDPMYALARTIGRTVLSHSRPSGGNARARL